MKKMVEGLLEKSLFFGERKPLFYPSQEESLVNVNAVP
jgi:hypothetical protein